MPRRMPSNAIDAKKQRSEGCLMLNVSGVGLNTTDLPNLLQMPSFYKRLRILLFILFSLFIFYTY